MDQHEASRAQPYSGDTVMFRTQVVPQLRLGRVRASDTVQNRTQLEVIIGLTSETNGNSDIIFLEHMTSSPFEESLGLPHGISEQCME